MTEIDNLILHNFLTSAYNQPHRHYHNMMHINFLHAKLHEWGSHEIQAREAERIPMDGVEEIWMNVQRAIWWHDFEYNIFTPPGLNEVRSANAYVEYAGGERDDVVYQAILATANHLEDQTINDTDDGMVIKLMLDCDLAGFAMSMDAVRRNSLNVLKEYEPLGIPDKTLLENRIKFLDKLLKRNRIFYTDYFFNMYEKIARQNIEESIRDTNKELAAL